MVERKTTLEDVEKVKELRAGGRLLEDIVKDTGLSRSTVSKILNGWRPVGKKPVRLTRNTFRRGPG